MKTLFIPSIEAGDITLFKMKMIPVIACFICVTIAMLIDLGLGVMKAKERGEVRSSVGFRMTVSKSVMYYSLLFLCFLIDFLDSILVSAPFFILSASIGLICVEIKSWYEKADKKGKQMIDVASNIVLKKDDIVKAVAEVINTQNADNETK